MCTLFLRRYTRDKHWSPSGPHTLPWANINCTLVQLHFGPVVFKKLLFPRQTATVPPRNRLTCKLDTE